MSSIMKVFLLLAVVVCISEAEQLVPQRCLCIHVRNRIGSVSDIKDIQIYQPTIFCDRVEIVVTNNSGLRYCLNPKLKAVQKLIATIKRKTSTTAMAVPRCMRKPENYCDLISTTRSANRTHI